MEKLNIFFLTYLSIIIENLCNKLQKDPSNSEADAFFHVDRFAPVFAEDAFAIWPQVGVRISG